MGVVRDGHVYPTEEVSEIMNIKSYRCKNKGMYRKQGGCTSILYSSAGTRGRT